jgi:sensor histidine kinase YesM
MFSHKYRYGFIGLLSIYSFFNTISIEALEAYRVTLSKTEVFLLFLVISWLVWDGNRLIEFLLQKKTFSNKNLYWVWQFGLSLLVTVVVVLLPVMILINFHPEIDKQVLPLHLKILLAFGFRINLFLNILNLIFFYIRKLRQTEIEAEEFKKISVQAQLQSLKNQVNPHFLFNNLNVLSALIVKNPETAVEFIERFSKVYRYVLQNQDKEIIELDSEIEFINSYLFLLKTRFNGSLNINLHINESARNAYVIPVALQMLIENAIKHNVGSQKKPLTVDVFTENDEKIVVRNNLQPKENHEPSTQIGLSNIAKRYHYLSSKQVEVIKENDAFIVKIPLLKDLY